MGASNENTAKTAKVMNLLGKGPAAGHVQADPPPQVRDIETITEEIVTAKLKVGENLFVIGRGLIEAKAQLSHGEWLPWLTMRVEFSEATAQNYMKLVHKYSNPEALRDLGYTKALALLALPDGIREEYIETTHIVDGEEKTVAEMSSRELKAALKERNEALKAAELAKAEQSAAEAARKKMAEDMALANERIAGLNAEVDARTAEGVKWQKEIARLEIELSELRNRPVEVAVQVDEKAVEAARKEAVAAMKSKLDEAKEAQKKARADLMEANSALQRAKLDREQAQIELEALRAQMERAEKEAVLASNEDLVLFRELFDRAQEQINRIHGLLLKARGKDADRAEKMSKALLSLSDKIREVAS